MLFVKLLHGIVLSELQSIPSGYSYAAIPLGQFYAQERALHELILPNFHKVSVNRTQDFMPFSPYISVNRVMFGVQKHPRFTKSG